MSRQVVQSLWIGNRLSAMEQLCIRSFLACGHEFHLYAYEPIANVPAGTVVKPGSEILPESEIFVYRRGGGKGSPSAFSNFFRYKVLLERGGWWADLDAVCLGSLDYAEEHVTGYVRQRDGSLHVAVGLFKAPKGSPLMEFCWDGCRTSDKDSLRWGQIGPRLFARSIEKGGAPIRILPPDDFYPIDHWDVKRLVRDRRFPHHSASIHLFNSGWRKAGLDPDSQYHPDCIYEQLMARFLPEGMLDEPIGPARFGPGAPRWRQRLLHAMATPWRRLVRSPRPRQGGARRAA